MRNPGISLEEVKNFFNLLSTPENIKTFFENGFPEILLQDNHLISLLKLKSTWDKTGTLLIITYSKKFLSGVIQTHQDFHAFFYSLDNEILTHLFSIAPFIQERFLNSLPAFLKWLSDERYSKEHRFFLMSYFEDHFFYLLDNHLSLGSLSRILSLFDNSSEKHLEFIMRAFQRIKQKIIHFFSKPDLSPYIHIFLQNISESELTLLFQHIPECFYKLFELPIKPKFFSHLIQFEKLNSDLQAQFQLRLLEDLCQQLKSPTYPVFAFRIFEPEQNDIRLANEINAFLQDTKISPEKKLEQLQRIISENMAAVSDEARKILTERQLLPINYTTAQADNSTYSL